MDDSHTGFRPVKCSVCQNNTGTIVLQDLKFYGKFLCDLCGNKFTYSNFDQCMAVQQVIEQALLSEYRNIKIPIELKFAEGIAQYNSHHSIDTLPIPPLVKAILKLGISLVFKEMVDGKHEELIRQKESEAKRLSYDIRPFFKELDNHIIDFDYYKRYLMGEKVRFTFK